MLPFEDALKTVLDSARQLGDEPVDIGQALNRVLAEDVRSDIDIPPFDKSLRDGYACRRADLANDLTVIETIPAGSMPTRSIGPNQCAKIMTGGVMPKGADCVIMQERVESPATDTVRVAGEQRADYISRRAEDIVAGEVVLKKGTLLKPHHIAVLAAVGHTRPLVSKMPRVGVMATGSELVNPSCKPDPAQIRNSNSCQLAAHVQAMGGVATDYGFVEDTEKAIDLMFKKAAGENDAVLVSGGVSVGDFDFVPAVLRQNEIELLFEKVAIKPGKPAVFGRRGQTYCFGLPGNPVSTFVVFELLVKPFLYRLMGHEYSPLTVSMCLEEEVTRKDTDRQSWIPVRRTGASTIRPVPYHGSAHVAALCEADGWVSLDIGVAHLAKMVPVCVWLLGRIGV